MPLGALACALLAGCAGGRGDSGALADSAAPVTSESRVLDIAPRFQWEENYGYCGETSLVSAGLYYGQYASQYDVRDWASDGANQAREDSQLLLGVNDVHAAGRAHLHAERWQGSGTEDFLAWVKENVLAGYPVIIGVYTNERRLYGDTHAGAGDAEYDHIVPVVGIGSNHPLTDVGYYADDTLTFSDNGLVGDDTPAGSEYLYTYAFGDFSKTRTDANAADAPWYALASEGANYGLVVKGPDAAATLPVRVATSVNYESPEITDGGTSRPEASAVELTVTVSGLEPGVDYVLYRYDDIDRVPQADFNDNAASAGASWPIRVDAGSELTVVDARMSSDVAVYRAVVAPAP